MLETVDLDACLSKAEYQAIQPTLDDQLAELQRALRLAEIPVMLVFEGWDAAGKGSVMGRLLQPLDPRGFKVYNTAPATPEEKMRPPMRRFWLTLPNDGVIGIYNHSWYRQVLDERVADDLSAQQVANACERIRTFERQLTDGGAVIVKFFFHISKKEQAKRFKKLAEDSAFAWKVGKPERERHKKYAEFQRAAEDMLHETSMPYAPWTLVPATDERFATVRVAETLVATFQHALESRAETTVKPPKAAPRRTSPLDRVNLQLAVPREEYDKRLPKLQTELRRLQHLCYFQRKAVVIVYEGWDASGKGGNIRRLTRNLDPRGYEVVPIAAPQGEERTHHYLWRFWRALPKAGHFTVFDRSWYGRVMVERVEGFAKPEEWTRAYREINEFEAQLVEAGTVVTKFWLHVSKEEQLARFEARQNTPEKQWKITDEDWRNRGKWEDYYSAVSDMIEWTSTAHAPWVIVEANDKPHARLKTLQVLIDRISAALDPKGNGKP
ncbi:MAG: polyphosphate:AMP phosphotransferase [FCB group bacterium]|jgi:polyphosphate:AMP phosphotransferase|nr:polyphosphate:AMP phosphotransferase [FCB group bacterium]